MTGAEESRSRVLPVLSRREVEGLIAEGKNIFILDEYVLKADAWIPYHPGGAKPIEHLVGRDATDVVHVYHARETIKRMERYRIGRIEGRWKDFVPPVQGGEFRPLAQNAEDALTAESDVEADDDDDDVNAVDADTSHERIPGRLAPPQLPTANFSRSPSPEPSSIFDASTLAASSPASSTVSLALRSRPAGRKGPRSVSGLSLSSSATGDDHDHDSDHSDHDASPLPLDGMAHLNVLTKKEIQLDLDKYPPLDPDTQERIQQKYRLLWQRIQAEGLFETRYWCYLIELSRWLTLLGLSLLCVSWKWYSVGGLFMGGFWHQMVFAAHDAGHLSITHNFQVDSVLGILLADFAGGLSMGWWKRSHNVHHIVPNSPEDDPDAQQMPFFALSHRFLGSLRSTYYDRIMEYDAAAKALISLQHYTFYFLLMFGRFNLYRLSWVYLFSGQALRKGPAMWHRYLEIAGQVFFWYWYGYKIMYQSIDSGWGRLAFFFISHLVTSPLHLQITLSHFAMSTADLGVDESFPQRQLRTTMDIDCPRWLDFIHGGLQFQAVHHLFPRVPRHNLRATQRLVQQFCNEVGIPYALYGFVSSNKVVVGRLTDVARQAAILAKCQSTLTAEAFGGVRRGEGVRH